MVHGTVSFPFSRLAFKRFSISSLSFRLSSPLPAFLHPIFCFLYIQCYFLSSFYFSYTFSSSSISACRVFLRIVFFLYPSVSHFSFALLSSSLVSCRSEIGLGTGVDIGSICDLPRATITCNTVGLSGPMGTRWGVLSVRKKDITVTHIESGAAPLRRARSVALVLSWLTRLMIC